MIMNITEIAKQAKEASYKLTDLSIAIRNKTLLLMAETLVKNKAVIFEANQQDLMEVAQQNLPSALQARLKFDEDKLSAVVQGIRDIIRQPDPIHQTLAETQLDEGLTLYKVSCPIGVIAVIFEARPDVLPQIVPLAVKSGNAVILKGGSEASRTNDAIMKCLLDAASKVPVFPKESLRLIHGREEVDELLKQDAFVDLIIPRGGNHLIQHIKQNTKIPVLGHADGVCHIYIAPSAPLESAVQICVDSKTQYPAACNAVETILLDSRLKPDYIFKLLQALKDADVTIHSDKALAPGLAAEEAINWHTEYGDKALSVKVVPGLAEAVVHINTYGSHHTDCILTEDENEAREFMNRVDSSSVYWNASTRFTDGFRYGLGAEVGISTNKTHARGPVGVEGLTIYKYQLIGHGQTVAQYCGVQGKKFIHQKSKQGGIP